MSEPEDGASEPAAVPGLDDDMVAQMADRNHVPEEMWLIRPQAGNSVDVRCSECHQPWPCATRLRLRHLGWQ
jgi:hypothetical protein